MSVLAIPFQNGTANLTEKVVLEGVTYILNFRWNARAARYTMDISKADGTLIIAGLTLENGWFTTSRYFYRVLELPLGQFIPIDELDEDRSPDLANFGNGVALCYIEASA